MLIIFNLSMLDSYLVGNVLLQFDLLYCYQNWPTPKNQNPEIDRHVQIILLAISNSCDLPLAGGWGLNTIRSVLYSKSLFNHNTFLLIRLFLFILD